MKKEALKKVLLAVVISTMFFSAGCSSPSTGSTASSTSTTGSAVSTSNSDVIIPAGKESKKLLEVRNRGLIVGSGNDEPYLVNTNGKLEGLEAEIIKAVAKKLGITKIVPKDVTWDNYTVEVKQGSIDLFGEGVYVTKDRLKQMNMTNVTYKLTESLVVKGDSGITSVNDLKDKRVASSTGMMYMDLVKKWAKDGKCKTAVEGGAPNSLVLDVKTGKCDAAMMDVIISAYLVKQPAMSGLKVLANYQPESSGLCGYVMNKNDTEFCKEFDEGLDAIKKDGTLLKILTNYGAAGSFVNADQGQTKLQGEN